MTYFYARAGSAILAAALLMPAVLPADAPHPIAVRVEAARQADKAFVAADLFSDADTLEAVHTKSAWGEYAELSGMLAGATLMELRVEALSALRTQAPDRLSVEVPFLKAVSGLLTLDLVKVSFFAPGFTVTTARSDAKPTGDIGVHYQGVLRGEAGSVAAVSIYGDEVVGFVGSKSLGHVAIGTVEQSPLKIAYGGRTQYIAYAEDDLVGFDHSFSCQFRGERSGDVLSTLATEAPPAVAVPTADVFEPNRDAAKAAGLEEGEVGFEVEVDAVARG
ncbi:MAG: hypothetical protein AAFY88_30975, partial [Acidobacteriota bacterium]